MADAVQKDKVGLAQEFEDVPAPAQENPPAEQTQAPQKFSREIDVGGRLQRFEADTYEGLIDKLVEAQTHATKKLHELSQERKAKEPEKVSSDWQEVRPSRLAPDELNQLQSNPYEMMRRVFQAETGLSFEDFRERENAQRRAQAEAAAQDAFVRKYPEYNPSPENAQKILRLLEHENLPLSKRNLEWAYGELRDQLAVREEAAPGRRVSSQASERPAAEPVPAPAQPVERTRSTPPSFVRANFGEPPLRDGGGQEAEIERIARSSSLPEMKARIEQYFRQSRTSAR